MNKFGIIGIGVIPMVGCNQGNNPGIEQKNSSKPNIIFCIADDASYPHFSAYGCKWISTPGFDRVAREGILFNNAYTPNSKSAPSRACVLTGRNSWQLEEAANHISNFPEKFKTFMEALGENGYYVGFTSKGWGPGNPGMINGKPRELTGLSFGKRKTEPPARGMSKDDYSANFKDFLDQKPENTPWCFWYGGREPHRGYQYGSGVKVGGKNISQIESVPDFWPDNDTIRNDMLDYALEIEYFDKNLEEMLNELDARGELKNTLVIVTADNGMPFPRCKGFQNEYSNHMPLAIMWPEGIKNPGRTVEDYISFIDFAPTFLEVAGLPREKSGMAPSPGRSLVDIFNNETNKKNRSFILLGQERHDYGRPLNQGYPVRSIIKDGFLFEINYKPDLWPAGNPETGYLNTDGSPSKTFIINLRRQGIDRQYWEKCFGKHENEQLFNLTTDRECLVNLAYIPDYKQKADELRALLIDELMRQDDPRVKGNGDIFDKYPFDSPEKSDFYERYMNGEIKKYQTNWADPTDYEVVKFDSNNEKQ